MYTLSIVFLVDIVTFIKVSDWQELQSAPSGLPPKRFQPQESRAYLPA